MATALATTQPNPLATLKALFERSRASIAEAMPRHLSVERILRVTLAAVGRTPLLLQCDQASILKSVMVAAQLGLEPTGVLGSAYLVPYRNTKTGRYEAQLIIGYRGLIDLARRSGQIASIDARVVRTSDRFICTFGLLPVLEHEPCWDDDPGELRAVYAVARLTDGSTQLEVMTKAEIEKIRLRAKAGNNGPWITDYEEMARKTVVRRLAKYLPLSVELETAFRIQQDAEAGEVTDYSELSIDLPEIGETPIAETAAAPAPPPPPVTTAGALKDVLKTRAAARPAAPPEILERVRAAPPEAGAAMELHMPTAVPDAGDEEATDAEVRELLGVDEEAAGESAPAEAASPSGAAEAELPWSAEPPQTVITEDEAREIAQLITEARITRAQMEAQMARYGYERLRDFDPTSAAKLAKDLGQMVGAKTRSAASKGGTK